MKRRHCLTCDKRLRWYRTRKRFPTVEAARAFIDVHVDAELRRDATITDETAIVALSPSSSNYRDGAFVVQYIEAEGDRGDNRFCGLNCGYLWATSHSREARPR